MRQQLSLFALVLVLAAACSLPVDTESEKALLLQLDRDWSRAASGDDMNALLAFWAEDAVIYPAGAPAVVGKEAIREFLMKNRDIPGFSLSWEPEKAVVSASGDLGYTLGAMQIGVSSPEGNRSTRHGKYTVVWEKQVDGRWQSVVDMFNFDQGPPVRQAVPAGE
jgi:ketosteroid isomerase-like protein